MHLTSALILGLALMIVPLITMATFSTQEPSFPIGDLPKHMRSLEHSDYDSQSSEASRELEMLSVSFFAALGIYLYVKGKRPRRDYRIMGQYPF